MSYVRLLATQASVVRKRQTYGNLLYLLTIFPLGLVYAVTLGALYALGFGLAILGVGLVILVLTLGLTWTVASAERSLAIHLLRVEIVPMPEPWFPNLRHWQRIWSHLRHPLTWKSMAFIALKVPLGLATLAFVAVTLLFSLRLLFYPLGLALPFKQPFILWIPANWIWQHVPQPMAALLMIALSAAACSLGFLLTVGSFLAFNLLAAGWGLLARALLSQSLAELQLAEARVTVVRAQAQAEISDQRRRDLLVNVSHELRTPIANIRGHIESLRQPMGTQLSSAEKDRYLAIVAREAERLSSLVDDLLSLARADAGELRVDIQPVLVGEVVAEVHQALGPLATRERQVTVVRNVAPGLPPALADRDRLTQVLLNLARNAITATPAGGLVFLDLEPGDEGHIRLQVSDTGHGIPPEEIAQVFERFYRADASRQRATGGFGLGLAIVRDLVQAMGISHGHEHGRAGQLLHGAAAHGAGSQARRRSR